MYRKTRNALLALALGCAAAVPFASPAAAHHDAEGSLPACLNIVDLLEWSLRQDDQGAWSLTVTQQLADTTCRGGATYSLHTLTGSTANTVVHSAPTGFGTNTLTFTVPVETYETTCLRLGVVPVTATAVKAYATTARGSHGDRTTTSTFTTDPESCPPGAAGWH